MMCHFVPVSNLLDISMCYLACMWALYGHILESRRDHKKKVKRKHFLKTVELADFAVFRNVRGFEYSPRSSEIKPLQYIVLFYASPKRKEFTIPHYIFEYF